MRILHVLNSPALGGTESWVLNLVAASPPGLAHELVLFDGDGPLRDEMAPHVSGVVRSGVSRPRRIHDLLRRCRAADADQIWLHSDLARAYGAFLPPRRHPVCVAVCHSPWGASTVLQRLRGPGRRGAWDGVITVSDALFADVPPTVDRTRLVALVPPPRHIARTSERGRDRSRPSLVYVARLVEGKGHELLLRALEIVRRDLPDVELVLVGDGPLSGHLADVAARSGVTSKVTFAGGVTDVVPFLSAADVFVHPSESEGLSISGLEAALAGLPIVARALPCHDGYLSPGDNGVTFTEPSAEALAGSILEVCDGLPRFLAGADRTARRVADRLRVQFETGLAEVTSWE